MYNSNLKDYAKIHAGQIHLSYDLFSPYRIVKSVAEYVAKQLLQNPQIRLYCFTSPELPEPLRGDANHLYSMFLQLAQNALQFTHSGEIYLGCEIINLDDNNNTINLRFEVRDTGIGIPKEQLPHVFDPFVSYQPYLEQNEFKQRGLGLSIVKKITNFMGGETHVESAQHLGSRFWFDIPLAISHPHTQYPNLKKSKLEGRYILLATNSNTSQFILKQYLKAWKARPITAGDENEAMKMLRNSMSLNEPFYTIIVDQKDHQTAALVKNIRAKRRFDNLPIIALDNNLHPYKNINNGIVKVLEPPVCSGKLQDALLHNMKTNFSRIPEPAVSTPSSGLTEILLLEKNAVDALIITTIMEELPVRVDHINSDEYLIRKLIGQHYQLLLIGIQLADKKIYDTSIIEILRAWEQHNNQRPITVVATAPCVPGINPMEYLQAAGIDGYIPKPIRKADMQEHIKRWINIAAATPRVS